MSSSFDLRFDHYYCFLTSNSGAGTSTFSCTTRTWWSPTATGRNVSHWQLSLLYRPELSLQEAKHAAQVSDLSSERCGVPLLIYSDARAETILHLLPRSLCTVHMLGAVKQKKCDCEGCYVETKQFWKHGDAYKGIIHRSKTRTMQGHVPWKGIAIWWYF